jgi:Region found in RelA / SpoT proteins
VIPPSIISAYDAQSHLADLLIEELDELFRSKNAKWFYAKRKKTLESFHQKVESGKVADPYALEDFVGAMLVVPMLTDIPCALQFVDRFFCTDYRRPATFESTEKKSSEFSFDDLRIFGHLRAPDELPPRPFDTMRFEIQVKTFLQHAWSIATHDLVYKYDRVSWARSRVAYQLKAVLEHADLSVSSIASLEASDHLPAYGLPESRIQELIEMVTSEWPPEVLPADRRRQAENLDGLINALGIPDLARVRRLIVKGRTRFGGKHPDGLTPYQCMVEYASVFNPSYLKGALTEKRRHLRILVTRESLQRIGLMEAEAVNAVL